MAFINHNLFGVIILVTLMRMALASKNIDTATLSARLKVDGEAPNCWESLFELQACTGEIIMFFLNGETYLGPSCCQAIRVVGHDCWPDMLASLGFSSQEGHTLQGYCYHSPPSPTTNVLHHASTKVLN
ncbi:hypothetical protein RJT34_24874 [Clitoria ternatea]|uniref:Prolamin-like domain-containing protein n=1 Tax=Clitoria ternatea TaxID=43366 RepID=A0AAN9FRH5_CLITE